ncbi:MAG TPA: radical SAM protein [Burkholderiales bacterium]|nr:radical SAM protein [Burkholderiales bacterium]
MNYDIEADFILLRTCNYRCAYCFLPPEALGEKLVVHATPQVWEEAFNRNNKIWMIHITGGEPTFYPGFAELGRRLSQRHYLSLNSNLTGRELAGFAESVDPKRVIRINAGYHPAERHARRGNELFLRNVVKLRELGFSTMISVVATPEVLAEYDSIIEALVPTGLMPMPKVMRGLYRGRRYPDAYSDQERQEFCRRSLTAEQWYLDLLTPNHLRSTIGLAIDRHHLDRRKIYIGTPCAAGRDMVRIDPDGTVHRCGTNGPSMGNLLQGTWARAERALPCDRNYCFYYCEKYTAKARDEVTGLLRNTTVEPHPSA